MKVYSLTGKSGTGKSYQAMNLCKEKSIQSILDDGLFINGRRVEAGISAKRQKTTVGAIKTALFHEDEHCAQVKAAIRRTSPESILIIGTSDRMAEKIAARLELGEIDERIHIEDITSQEEREAARKQRVGQGKHVIPVPTVQLKRTFAGYFMTPLWKFRGKQNPASSERTVVRPTFSYLGDFSISDKVITDIAECLAEEHAGIGEVSKVHVNTSPDTMQIYVTVDITSGAGLWKTAVAFQKKLAEEIEYMTAFNVVNVSVDVRRLS